jgi:hypothetical protein
LGSCRPFVDKKQILDRDEAPINGPMLASGSVGISRGGFAFFCPSIAWSEKSLMEIRHDGNKPVSANPGRGETVIDWQNKACHARIGDLQEEACHGRT